VAPQHGVLQAGNRYSERHVSRDSRKNTGVAVSKDVDHFENQFKIQLDNIATFIHNVKDNIAKIAAETEASSAGYIDGELQTAHSSFEDTFETEEKNINELRGTFHQFAAEWM
jgi:hypothetical protein